ncbi:hypothetical protein HYH02_015088 [Chlamydomonas schloesseri]|uniref:PPM-type phosphatase domain-containing protein n=1 Tax=Chlamydomonas schloesseri TaxID=2026947 RepID=A0A835VQ33_9CHLO|nr:hypothetical protein HYH02_015088 [Chlamydomonas schloesseri]|eukprot:KAG2425037.1 hypothetical protein HYH02_015088 [Chlamydomonas schloesseri]
MIATPSIVVTGVFDGHGGDCSARYAQEAMLGAIAADRRLHAGLGGGDADATRAALKAAFARVDADLLAMQAAASSGVPGPGPAAMAAAGGAGSAAGASPLSSPSSAAQPQPVCRDGTTALVTVQLGGLLAVANAGDSRAVLCREGQAVRLSRDHTPALRSERERIEAAGGQVVTARGAARVLAPAVEGASTVKALSVSRSLGDPDFKATGLLISEPDVAVVPLVAGQDAFLISASDGLWGLVGDQQAVDAVAAVLAEYARMSASARSGAAKAAARALLKLAQDCGSVDDITVVVTVFAWGPASGSSGGTGAAAKAPTARGMGHAA